MLVELDKVCFAYGKRRALEHVQLRLPEGRIGLLGPNGAGKSTLLRILLGLLRPQAGTGHVLGCPLDQLDHRIRRQIGYMPESDCLLPGLSGIEYVVLAGLLQGLPRREAWRWGHRVLDLLGLEEARYRRLEEYSTGMKQRLKLAQALVHRPRLVLLDEPTAGLDPPGREAMLDLLVSLSQELAISVILSSHILAEVERVCQRIVLLEAGRVLAEGPLEQFRRPTPQQYLLEVRGCVASFCHALIHHQVHILEADRQALPAGRLADTPNAGNVASGVVADLVGDATSGMLRVRVPENWCVRRFFELAHVHQCVIHQLLPDASAPWPDLLSR